MRRDNMNDNSSFSLDKLLAWLDGDHDAAGRKYVQFQQQLIEYVARRGGHTVAEEMTDEAFNRIDKRLAVFLLNEHYNSSEIADVPNLCRLLLDEGTKNLPRPGRRIWELLSPAIQSLVSKIARDGIFKRTERSLISKALNEILKRRDFYRAEDFNLSAIRAEVKKNSKIENVEAALIRGLPQLSQSEIEKFNRRLLEAAYPQIIKTNLADTPEAEKLARCKHYAGVVLLEYLKEPSDFRSTKEDFGESKLEGAIQDTTSDNPVEISIEIEDEAEKRRMLACQQDCKRLKLSPRDSEIFDLYFTGIIVRLPDDEPLSDKEIKDGRKTLAAKYGVSPETIRTIVRRCKEVLQPCIERCIKRQEKK